jgi:hypothetical protein
MSASREPRRGITFLPPSRRHAPLRPMRFMACAIAISVALWALLILLGIHLAARLLP